MQKGKVKFYNTTKRYGFITGDDGTDYFFHQSGLSDDIYVKDNDNVEKNPASRGFLFIDN